jgi:hypothetical protein
LVKDYQAYIGTVAPISFNGLVRHYDLRSGDNVADIQVNLVNKTDRKQQSHDIVKSMRESVHAIAKKYDANVKLVEVPPTSCFINHCCRSVYQILINN